MLSHLTAGESNSFTDGLLLQTVERKSEYIRFFFTTEIAQYCPETLLLTAFVLVLWHWTKRQRKEVQQRCNSKKLFKKWDGLPESGVAHMSVCVSRGCGSFSLTDSVCRSSFCSTQIEMLSDIIKSKMNFDWALSLPQQPSFLLDLHICSRHTRLADKRKKENKSRSKH